MTAFTPEQLEAYTLAGHQIVTHPHVTQKPTASVGYVYVVLDNDNAVLYVGLTGNPYLRIGQHSDTQPWWPDANWVQVYLVGAYSDARDVESYLIDLLKPIHNIKHGAVPDGLVVHPDDLELVLSLPAFHLVHPTADA